MIGPRRQPADSNGTVVLEEIAGVLQVGGGYP